jgi:hypothetical protein
MTNPSPSGVGSCRLCAGETVCRAAVGERLVTLCPECLALIMADPEANLALRLAEAQTPISGTVH